MYLSYDHKKKVYILNIIVFKWVVTADIFYKGTTIYFIDFLLNAYFCVQGIRVTTMVIV